MAAIVNTDLAGYTVTYNGVQFGGSDAPFIDDGSAGIQCKSFPPMYRLVARARMDGSKRALVGLDISLQLRCIFYASTEPLMALAMQALRTTLCQPGKKLTILGIGNLFGTNGVIQGVPEGGAINSYDDLSNGPHPHPLEMTSLGQLAWEVSWGIDFFISECQAATPLIGQFLELVYSTTWRNDFEGISQRILQGYVVYASNRSKVNTKLALSTADQFRNSLTIAIPNNFKRVENIWHESEDKTRLDFTVIDQQEEGDPYPIGITQANGSFSFGASAGDDNIGMNKGIATLNMTLKVAPNQPKNLARLIFFTACLAKQVELTALNALGLATITVLPIQINITNGKWDNARVTQCSMSWYMTKTLDENLAAANIWGTVNSLLPGMESGTNGNASGVNDYTNWKANMLAGPMWRNTGTSGLTNALVDAHVIDLCDNITERTIGNVAGDSYNPASYTIPSLVCPAIPLHGGWIHCNFIVRIHREDSSIQHHRAASYIPEPPHSIIDPLLDTDNDGTTLAGPYYNQDPSDQHVTEYNGQPTTYIGMTFAALRYKNKPYLPVIKSVSGLAAVQDKVEDQGAVQAFEVFGCPVWKIEGYRTYKVAGIVNSIKEIRQIDVSAAALNDPSIGNLRIPLEL